MLERQQKGNPKTLKRVGRNQKPSVMRIYISFRVWKIRVALEISL